MIRKIARKGSDSGVGIPPGLELPYALKDRLLDLWSATTDRSKVARVGPSGIGQPCAFCLGTEMAWSLPGGERIPRRTKYPSFRGTLIHDGLEELMPNLLDDWLPEKKLHCGEVEGYGEIKGSTDALALQWETLVDWKALGRTSYDKVLRYGLGQAYDVQRMTYAHGADLAGYRIKFVMNVIFPMHKANWNDIIWKIAPVDDFVREAAYERAAIIWHNYVLTGRVEALASDPENCFNCSDTDWFN